jgi:hypothetical protein
MSSKIVLGMYIPADLSVEPRVVPIGGLEDIREHIGGYIDAVTTVVDPEEFGHDGAKFAMVGYVHDEGLLLDMPLNERACVLFERKLVGDVVVVSGTNPDNGVYDGENYDMPSWYVDRIVDGTLDWIIVSVGNMADRMAEAMELAVEDGLFDRDDIDTALRGMEVGRHNLHPEDVEIIDMIIMTCLAYHVNKTGTKVPNIDRRGLELLKQGVTDEMLEKLLDEEA